MKWCDPELVNLKRRRYASGTIDLDCGSGSCAEVLCDTGGQADDCQTGGNTSGTR